MPLKALPKAFSGHEQRGSCRDRVHNVIQEMIRRKEFVMKRLITLLLAAGLVCSSMSVASAADVKVKGMWDFNFEYGETSFSKNSGEDRFKAKQRLRTQIDIVASESLRGVLAFEIGDTNWGTGSEGASLGTDGRVVEVRYSYVDWTIPETDVRVRMGLQPFILPGFVAGSAILDADGAGISIAYNFDDTIGANLFWLRAENDNNEWRTRYDDNQNNAMDFVGLAVPVKFEGVKVTPWGMYGFVGNRSLSGDAGGDINDVRVGMMPVLPGGFTVVDSDFYTNKPKGKAWWAGITGEVLTFNPFRLAIDYNYGSVDLGSTYDFGPYNDAPYNHDIELKRRGWLVSGIAEYKLDFITPGLLMWYGSGDNSNPYDGSERMPTIDPSWTGSSFGFDGGYGIARDTLIGTSPVGTWGAALRLKDISFIENLNHTLQVGYYRGTNNKDMPKNAGMRNYHVSFGNTGDIVGSTYLTKKDGAWEADFNTEYQIYKDLTMVLELGYIHLSLNNDVWGSVIDETKENAYKVGLNMRYAF